MIAGMASVAVPSLSVRRESFVTPNSLEMATSEDNGSPGSGSAEPILRALLDQALKGNTWPLITVYTTGYKEDY